MSKSATASSSKPPLPSKSAWSKGPPTAAPTPKNATPTASPRPSSPSQQTPPASVSHSRRSSTLGQGIPIKDGVSIPQRAASAVKQGSAVTFGSIDDVSAPISSSPASVPTLKPQGVKTFGTLPAGPAGAQPNGKSSVPATKPAAAAAAAAAPTPSAAAAAPAATSAPSKPAASPSASKPTVSRADIAKLFQSPSSAAPTPAPTASDAPARSPAQGASAPLPPATPGAQPSPLPHTFTPFVPANAFRGSPAPSSAGLPPQNGGPPPPVPGSPLVGPPRSPAYGRGMSNGGPPGSRGGPPGQGGPPLTPQHQAQGLPSPRMAPQGSHGVHSPGMPPQGMPMAPQWPGYYYQYPGMPPPEQMYGYGQGWPMAQMSPHQHPHPHHPGQQGPPGPPHLSTMSPRAAPQTLAPGTPTQQHAQPAGAPPHPQQQQQQQQQQPPPTPTTPATPGGVPRLNTNAMAFVPGGRSKISIKDASGNVVELRKHNGVESAGPTSTPATPVREASKRVSVRLETPEAKRAREEKEREEKEKAEREVREKAEAETREKEAAEKKVKEEEERKVQDAERKKREEEERVRKEEEEKAVALKAKEDEERKVKEEEERKAKEEEERKVREEDERKALQEIERKEKEEAERLAREQQEKQHKEEEEKKAAAAAAAAATEAKASTPAPAAEDEKEDGEIVDEPTAKDKVKESLKIDTALAPPVDNLRRRPGRLDLSSAQKPNIPGSLPSALATARIIEDISQVQYPEGIMSPKIELNVNAKDGKFRYDRDFLLQFMAVCKEKPDMLPPLDAIGLEPTDQTFHHMARGGSGSGRRASGAMPPPSLSRQASVGLGLGMGNFGGKQGGSGFSMGQFATAKSSEERFALASGQRTPSGTSGPPSGFRPAPMTRGGSQPDSGRRRSKRGEKRPPQEKGPSAFAPAGQTMYGPDGLPLPPVKPLEKSADAWNPLSKVRNPPPVQDETDPVLVDRKVKGLLNKLTMEKFDSISDQIIGWANKSEDQTDGRTLIQVIRLVFEKATDEAAWSEMYARLCRKMMEQISPKVQDEGIRNPEGKPIAGGQLFRKYLLNRCQEDFERGWAMKDAAAAAAAAKSTEDAAAATANEGKAEGDDEIALYSEEYYASQKAKRQGLGLVKFIGELFKLQMLTERIMHVCVKKLVGNVENPEEEEIESLCKLLTTVGRMLDTDKASGHMDVYFQRMKEMVKNPKVNSRMQYMLQDIIELRENKWTPRNAQAAPATIAQIREQAAKDDAKEANQRTLGMSRGGSRRGGDRGDGTQIGPDGWAVAGGAAARPPPKAGDLSQFGKIAKSSAGSMTFGPSNVFAKKGDTNKRESVPRQTSMNMFSMLSQNPEIAAEVAAPAAGKSSRPPSRKPSVDLGSGGAPDAGPMQRRKLQLLPRSKPVDSDTPAGSEHGSDEEDGETAEGPAMSEADATKKINEDLKEFFAIRNVDEGEEYFKLPAEHVHRLVDKLISKAIESKEADAVLVGDLFARAVQKGFCTPEAFEEGFMPIAELLDDIAIDAPKAFNLMAIMMKGAGLAGDEERRKRIADKSEDSDKLIGLLV